MLQTQLCRDLGIQYPLFSAPMGPSAGPELVSAVSNAGGCGVLGAAMLPPAYIRQCIRAVRGLTNKPFGVNVILALLRGGEIEACLEEQVPFLMLFWGDPKPYVQEAHRRGTRVFVQVGSVEEARAAAEAGADAIIAQGVEAGGHVRGTTSLFPLVPSVVEAVKPVPVVTAGGIATGRGVVAALSLGAQAVLMGTRFLASEEAFVPREYKERVVSSRAEDTVYTSLFDRGWTNAPHRVLRNKEVAEWEATGRPPSGQRPGEGSAIGTVPRVTDGTLVNVPRYTGFMMVQGFKGDMERAPLFAGESCSLVNDIKPAGQIVREIMQEAEETIRQIKGT